MAGDDPVAAGVERGVSGDVVVGSPWCVAGGPLIAGDSWGSPWLTGSPWRGACGPFVIGGPVTTGEPFGWNAGCGD
jgi:hypothetical protein